MENEAASKRGGYLMGNAKFHIYLDDEEYSQVVQCLIELKNNLMAQGRYTDGVDDLLIRLSSLKKRKVKVQYI